MSEQYQTMVVVLRDGRRWNGTGPSIGDLAGAKVAQVIYGEAKDLPSDMRFTTLEEGEDEDT